MQMRSPPSPAEHVTGLQYRPGGFDQLFGWANDDHLSAFWAFRHSAEQMVRSPYRQRSSIINAGALMECASKALAQKPSNGREAKEFFEINFVPHNPVPDNTYEGFVTGYYEPELRASLEKREEYCFPLYRRPEDLIDLDDQNRPPTMDRSFRYGRMMNGKITEYFDRAAIQSGALANRGLELAWLKDKTDAFFVHVQGSARLVFPDNRIMRIAFAAKSGHAYTSLAQVLCDRHGFDPALMTADRLAEWMRSHPETIDDFLAQNRSYIFFRQIDGLDHDAGPVGAAKIPLIAGRSLAVDRSHHTFGVPFWVDATRVNVDTDNGDDEAFSRLMIAHDTGSAIIGPQRGDIFVGSGSRAGLVAGRIRSAARMTILAPIQ